MVKVSYEQGGYFMGKGNTHNEEKVKIRENVEGEKKSKCSELYTPPSEYTNILGGGSD